MSLTRKQQKEQGARCPCGGSDDYCVCQNVDRSTPTAADTVKLHCRGCGKQIEYARSIDQSLPLNVVRIESAFCDDCDDGDRGMETWFDADGKEVPQS